MNRLVSSALGCAAGAGALYLTYLAVDAAALSDAQNALLFIPVMMVGALAGEAIGSFVRTTRHGAGAAAAFTRNGIAALLIVALFVWVGSENAGVAARLSSPWLLIPALLGIAQLALGRWLPDAPRR